MTNIQIHIITQLEGEKTPVLLVYQLYDRYCAKHTGKNKQRKNTDLERKGLYNFKDSL